MEPWHPRTLQDWDQFYPKTKPWRNVSRFSPSHSQIFLDFVNHFDAVEDFSPQLKSCKIIVLRGFYASFMPNNFRRPISYLRKIGFEVELAPIKSGADVKLNGEILDSYLSKQTKDCILLCHSKGGLDYLRCLNHERKGKHAPNLKGLIFSQTPNSSSTVLDQIFQDSEAYKPGWFEYWKNSCMKQLIKISRHHQGARSITRGPFIELKPSYLTATIKCPFITVATWSIKASSWVDSYHKRLSVQRPQAAHDGQFYLEQQFWPEDSEQLILGGVDHAQPAMGGLGFDHCRYWHALLKMIDSKIS